MSSRKAANHRVAGPAQRGNGQQQIRLVRDPVPEGAGATALILGGGHGVLAIGLRFTDAVAPPDLTTGPVLPGSPKDTDFDLVSTAQDASRPCTGPPVRPRPWTNKKPRGGSPPGGLEFEGCRSGGLGRLDLADVGRSGNRDPARLHGLRNFADQLNLQQAVIKRRALNLDIIGQVELALERPRRDA